MKKIFILGLFLISVVSYGQLDTLDIVRLLNAGNGRRQGSEMIKVNTAIGTINDLIKPSKRICAYYPNWSNDSYTQANIPYDSLTHIFHFCAVPSSDGTIAAEYAGMDEANFITKAHAKNIKVSVVIGDGNAAFATIVVNAGLRATFAHNINTFINTYNYDGVDLDWEFPLSAAERNGLSLTCKAIRDTFNVRRPTALLSIAIPCDNYINGFYNYDSLSVYTDFYNLMAYDLHTSGSTHSGPTAPVYQGGDPETYHNIDRNLNFLLNVKHIPTSKINMGLPFYGYSYATCDSIYTSCGAATMVWYRTVYTDYLNGSYNYYNDWTTETPYMLYYDNSKIMCYDDEASIADKVHYALVKKGLGGVFMWQISGDRNATTGDQPLFNAMWNTFIMNFKKQ